MAAAAMVPQGVGVVRRQGWSAIGRVRASKEIGAGCSSSSRCCVSAKGRELLERRRVRNERAVVPTRAQTDAGGSTGVGSEIPTRADVYGNENLDALELIAPDDRVEDIMTPLSACASILSNGTLQEARAVLQNTKIEGMPVVNEANRVLGVITRHDLRPIIRMKNHKEYMNSANVSEIMSTPPVCVRPHARIGEAAGVMLAYKVHRLPVVDESGSLLGIVSRTDIFQPLLRKKESIMGSQRRLWINGSFPDNSFVDLDGFDSLASLPEDSDEFFEVATAPTQNWEYKYLYDGDCSLCLMLVDMLKRRDTEQKICFVNLRDPDYDENFNQGITFEQGMKSIHVILKDNTVLEGTEALQVLYDAAELGWVRALMNIPIIPSCIYKIVSFLRLPLSDTILAARRMRSAENDDLDWACDDDDDEGCEVPDDW